MREASKIQKDLNAINNNSAQSFFKTLNLLREAAEGYRATSKNYDKSVMYSSILEHYKAVNINNGSGKFLIAL
jgi:hypothetical protein